MPQSPYQTTVYPPLRDLDNSTRELMRHRVSLENGESDFERDEYLLDIGEALLNQCKFLETKLSLERKDFNQLDNQKDALEKKHQALKKENQAQKVEIAALKSELEKTGAATGIKEQSGEGEGSQVTAGMVNSRKRGAEDDAAIDGQAMKKGKRGKK